MGDRANVKIKNCDDKAVFLYTHWGGSELAATVQAALAKKWRWNSAAYLARIVFDQMTIGDHGTETGYGISSGICDNGHPIITLDCQSQTVSLQNEDGSTIEHSGCAFQRFVDLTPSELADWYEREYSRT